MSGDVQEIANAIKDIVAAGGQVPGSRLSTSLKARIPGWSPLDFGVRSLREFIATHVAGVIVSGRSGMDVTYALEGVAPQAPHPDASQTMLAAEKVDFWRVWVSPNSPHALAVDRAGTALRAVPRRGPVEGSEVLVEPPGVDAHREVARAFLPSFPPALQVKMQAVLESPRELWWQAWLREVRGTEHLAAWNTFRRQKLEEHLTTQLQSAGLEQHAIDGVVRIVRESHVFVSLRTRRAAGEAPLQENDAALRRIVIEAVQRMSVSELRELRLPIGIVLDVLAMSKSR